MGLRANPGSRGRRGTVPREPEVPAQASAKVFPLPGAVLP